MQTHDYFIYKNDNVFNIKGFHRDRKKLFEEQWSIIQWGFEQQTFEWQTFTCSVFQWFTIQMPGSMVPGTWTADQYTNGGLHTGLLT